MFETYNLFCIFFTLVANKSDVTEEKAQRNKRQITTGWALVFISLFP